MMGMPNMLADTQSSAPDSLRDLASFRDRHAGETIIVCGCGESLNELERPERFITIGVNDVGQRFHPTYLVVVNPKAQFKKDRWPYVERSEAEYLFTQLPDLPVAHLRIVHFRLGAKGGTDLSNPNVLPYTQNSPYVALCLAAHMGAKRIGLIGVDFTDHHFFGKTGRHSLAGHVSRIDQEYGRLVQALMARGIEVVNLSPTSRLTTIPKRLFREWESGSSSLVTRPTVIPRSSLSRVFVVGYQFLSAGDVFSQGLRHATAALGVKHEEARWDDPRLPHKVEQFNPDLLFVVHGRRFAQRWGEAFKRYKTAVWLLDEPYEVDDTSKWSRLFQTVFVNDPSTVVRHGNAHYLPVCYDPQLHSVSGDHERPYQVGFVGGYNGTRERYLLRLAQAGMLSYVVGGPWKSPVLRRMTLAANVTPERTAELYRASKIVVNVFRETHHFNRQRVPAWSMNPRIYEALACGAMVVSERRPEVEHVFPEIPLFSSEEELLTQVERYLEDRDVGDQTVMHLRQRLHGHTYEVRLRTAVQICLNRNQWVAEAAISAPSANALGGVGRASVARPAEGAKRGNNDLVKKDGPTFGILMVSHNALEMVRLSICHTLKCSAKQSTQLIVVDNASKDGTVQWLRLLAARGDIQLIENMTNLGHGPGLELARKQSTAPYLVTLDSDAFPLSDTWLDQLRARLIGPVKAVGIPHHRGYIHPSCLMVHRNTLDELNVTLVAEKDKPSRFDVAERLSYEIKRRGGTLSGLHRTGAIQRGSLSEPVYLGSEYEGIVYHQWYTSRAATAGGAQVDDVPQQAIDVSLQTLFDRYDAEPREVTVIIGARVRPNEPERLRNLIATLRAVNLQDLARWRYRIIVVEQDDTPRIQREVAPFVDRYLFAYNPGPYNRGWAFNIGATLPASRVGALCLLDADLLVPPDFLSRCLTTLQEDARALLPYQEVMYLDKRSTESAIQRRQAHPLLADHGIGYTGQRFTTSQGGCIWLDAGLYHSIGGHDEEFLGWGTEDREFWDRLNRAVPVQRLPGQLFHLYHPRPAMDDGWARANQRRYQAVSRARPRTLTEPMGRFDRYCQKEPDTGIGTAQPVCGWRQWEHWNRWDLQRIHNIVRHEVSRPLVDSIRRRLASVLVRFGHSVLDVGCGPGAMSVHLMPHRHRVSWMGIDVTANMLSVARVHHSEVPLVRGDVGMLPFKNNSHDVVLLRHVLEHLPAWLMQNALTEAIRVARRAVVVDFYVPPVKAGKSRTTSVGEGFLETQWAHEDLLGPITSAGWGIYQHFSIVGKLHEKDEVWVLAPSKLADEWNNPKVSIVMPTYRRPHTIFRTVDSILAQTYSNWELIIVDNTGEAPYQFTDSRIRLYRDAGTASASYARNQGLRHVTGDLVCFFDDDDDMFPTYLERFVNAFREHPQANMVCCGMLLPNGQVNYSYATPECWLRRPFAEPSWTNSGPLQDQQYFQSIVKANGWSEQKGDIGRIPEALCHANSDPRGGLRSGRY